jgi:hypothetical protein
MWAAGAIDSLRALLDEHHPDTAEALGEMHEDV